tara:strand:- start:2484 stop:2654 length:171 start_codon:yes stop_codon:yes gene_type:complete
MSAFEAVRYLKTVSGKLRGLTIEEAIIFNQCIITLEQFNNQKNEPKVKVVEAPNPQ